MTNFEDRITSPDMGISIKRGAWSDDSRDSERMEWLSNSFDLLQRNIRLMTELDSPSVSENLVGPGLVEDKSSRSKESAIINKLLLIEE